MFVLDAVSVYEKVGTPDNFFLREHKYCPKCNLEVSRETEVLSEKGWETRTVTVKCKCKQIFQYFG